MGKLYGVDSIETRADTLWLRTDSTTRRSATRRRLATVSTRQKPRCLQTSSAARLRRPTVMRSLWATSQRRRLGPPRPSRWGQDSRASPWKTGRLPGNWAIRRGSTTKTSRLRNSSLQALARSNFPKAWCRILSTSLPLPMPPTVRPPEVTRPTNSVRSFPSLPRSTTLRWRRISSAKRPRMSCPAAGPTEMRSMWRRWAPKRPTGSRSRLAILGGRLPESACGRVRFHVEQRAARLSA